MKKKRSLSIFIFALIAFIVLGVGYAAINNINLIINGTGSVTATQSNFDVRFLDVDGHRPTITPGSPNTVSVIDNTTASFDVSTLSKKGDTATATIDVKNNSNGVGARIGLNLTNSNDTYFKVTEHIADTELQAGDITTVTVTVEMLKTPVSADEVTNITATLTANPIENSSATGSDSAEKKVPADPIWTLPAGRTATTLQVGDELQIKDQSFYFIRYDENNKAVLLAKYNLKVGDIYNSNYSKIGQYTSGDSGYGLQSSDAKGYMSGASTYNGIVVFTQIHYWMDKSTNPNTLKSPYNENNTIYYDSSSHHFRYVSDNKFAYPTIYDSDYVTAPNSYNNTGYSIAYYVEEYKSILEGVGYGATIDDARLLLYSEALSVNGGSSKNIPEDSILRETSFWLGSAYYDDYVWTVASGNSGFVGCNYNYGLDIGVRPVLIISPSNI
ncbi:MAG: hypothetical protein IIT65_01685 [Lachnospiraceae bacterium]|nr:hypothetical protein [Lachnospiraceae bacterium]